MSDVTEMHKEIEIFERELINALSGKDLEGWGLKNDPFILDKKDAPFLNRDDEKKILSRQIYRLSRGDINLVSIHGERGIGKTSFIFNIIPILERLKEDLGFNKIIAVNGLVDFENKFVKSDTIIQELLRKPQDKFLFIVDDLDIIFNRYREQTISFLEDIKYCIGLWTTTVLKEVESLKTIKLPPSEELLLKPLSKDICKSIVLSRIKRSMVHKDNPLMIFEEKVIEDLVIYSNGNPQNLLSICQQFFTFLIIRKCKKGDVITFKKFRELNKLRSSEEIFNIYNTLSDRQKEVFNIISKSIEVSYLELTNKISIARSTAVEYLIALKDKGLLEVKSKGKHRVYYVPPEIAYALERRI